MGATGTAKSPSYVHFTLHSNLNNLRSPFAGTRHCARCNNILILGTGDHRCRSIIVQQTVMLFPKTTFPTFQLGGTFSRHV